jgi:hypothetical protein
MRVTHVTVTMAPTSTTTLRRRAQSTLYDSRSRAPSNHAGRNRVAVVGRVSPPCRPDAGNWWHGFWIRLYGCRLGRGSVNGRCSANNSSASILSRWAALQFKSIAPRSVRSAVESLSQRVDAVACKKRSRLLSAVIKQICGEIRRYSIGANPTRSSGGKQSESGKRFGESDPGPRSRGRPHTIWPRFVR